jgi:hypothetical protein
LTNVIYHLNLTAFSIINAKLPLFLTNQTPQHEDVGMGCTSQNYTLEMKIIFSPPIPIDIINISVSTLFMAETSASITRTHAG